MTPEEKAYLRGALDISPNGLPRKVLPAIVTVMKILIRNALATPGKLGEVKPPKPMKPQAKEAPNAKTKER